MNRSHEIVLNAFTLLAAVSLLGACQSRSDPEEALYAYAGAVRENRCDDALNFLSERTRRSLDLLRVKPQHPEDPLPIEHYYCNKLAFEDCKVDKMTLGASDAGTATVSMPCGRTQDSIFPGFTSPFLKYEPRTMDLVLEDGKWRVVEPFVIRIAEIRERDDQMREAALRDHERRRMQQIDREDPAAADR